MRRALPVAVLMAVAGVGLATCPGAPRTGSVVAVVAVAGGELRGESEPAFERLDAPDLGAPAPVPPTAGTAAPSGTSGTPRTPGSIRRGGRGTPTSAPRVGSAPLSGEAVPGGRAPGGIAVAAPALDSVPPAPTRAAVTFAAAADPPTVDPGGIATLVVTVELPSQSAGDTLDYELHLAPGFRPYFPRTGFLAVPVGESRVRVPITLGVPANAPAGPMFAGQLRLRTPGATTVSDSMRVVINAVYDLETTLTAAEQTVEPGGSMTLHYRLRNRGNAVDSVALRLRISSGWTVRGLPSAVTVPAGDTASGAITVTAPREVLQGRAQSMTLWAAGAGRIGRATASVMLAAADPVFLDDWAHLPSTVFVGSSLGSGSGSSLALDGAGELAGGTRLTLSIRRREGLLLPRAFQEHMFGPRFRIGLRREGLRASAGEIQTLGGALSAPVLSGRGLEGRVRAGRWRAELYAARPGGLGSDLAGHQFRSVTSYATGYGEVGVTLSSIREEWPWAEGYRSTGAGIGYRLPESDSHDLWLQAGVLSVRRDSGESATGPAVDARYRFDSETTHLEFRGRLVPGTVLTNASLANEVFANGVYDGLPGLSLKAWGQLRSAPVLGSDYEPETSALFAGARVGIGTAQVEMGGLYRRTGNGIRPAVERRAAALGLDVPAGPVALQADALLGRFERGVESGPVRELWGGAQWTGAGNRSWARIGARYTDSEYIEEQFYLDLSGATELHRFRLEAGLASRLQDGLPVQDGLSFWSSVQFEALPHTFVTSGVDFQPGFGGESWRFSLGVARDFGLPLPIRHTPELYGLAFEDRNGNRLHDPEEPVLPGVRLQAGRLETRTEADGTFTFRKSYGGALRVDPASLPLRMALPPDLHLPSNGEVVIPVVEAGAVEVQLFMDRNGDGSRDPAEEAAADVLVSLIDVRGVARDLESDREGRARFGAVPPGDYTLRVIRRAAGSNAGAPLEREVRVRPGQATPVTIAVPARARTIRMGAGSELGLDPES